MTFSITKIRSSDFFLMVLTSFSMASISFWVASILCYITLFLWDNSILDRFYSSLKILPVFLFVINFPLNMSCLPSSLHADAVDLSAQLFVLVILLEMVWCGFCHVFFLVSVQVFGLFFFSSTIFFVFLPLGSFSFFAILTPLLTFTGSSIKEKDKKTLFESKLQNTALFI